MKINLNGKRTSDETESVEMVGVKKTGGVKLEIPVEKPKTEESVVKQERKKDQYSEAKDKLYAEFIQDMGATSIDASLTPDQMKSAQKKYQALIRKKMMIFVSLIALCVGLLLFGAWNTFIRHEWTGPEIAALSNYYNGQTNFPLDGVQGYIAENAGPLVEGLLIPDAGTRAVEMGTPMVTKITQKNHQYANVYFYMDIITNAGSQRVNCMVPIYWNNEEWLYQLAGNVIMTPGRSASASVEQVDNPYFTFDGLPKASDADNASSKTFVENFLSLLYSGQDISPYYKGDTLDPEGIEFVSLDEWTLYSVANQNGYNSCAKITVRAKNSGVSYVTEKYILIQKSGDLWIIGGVL